jgi:hypothetical protein
VSTRGDLLLVGRWPPPLGGVTVHVQRLSRGLISAGISHGSVDPRRDGLAATLRSIAAHRVCHIHVSHPGLQALLVAWARLWRTRSIVTLHGNLARFEGWKRWCTRWTLATCDVPVLLNEPSHREAISVHRRPILLSAFLQPAPGETLPDHWGEVLAEHASRFGARGPLIATNAFDLAYDDSGQEIYGVFALAAWCAGHGLGLVVCDPSGRYEAEARRRAGACTATSAFLTGPYSFTPVLERCDVYVRNTTTDGDSLSIHEALALGKPVWATDVVPRPAGTHVYRKLDEIDPGRPVGPGWKPPAVLDELIAIYTAQLHSSDQAR